jgi:hypothetical protein
MPTDSSTRPWIADARRTIYSGGMSPRRRRASVYIGDRRWRIVRKRCLPKIYGKCDYQSRTITVCSTLTGIDLLDTLIHEAIHARWPDLAEEAVEEVATTIAHLLASQGFTSEDTDDD